MAKKSKAKPNKVEEIESKSVNEASNTLEVPYGFVAIKLKDKDGGLAIVRKSLLGRVYDQDKWEVVKEGELKKKV